MAGGEDARVIRHRYWTRLVDEPSLVIAPVVLVRGKASRGRSTWSISAFARSATSIDCRMVHR